MVLFAIMLVFSVILNLDNEYFAKIDNFASQYVID